MNVTVCKSKLLKLFIDDLEMCVYIIDSGYINENHITDLMYHVIEEDAYGKSVHSLMYKSEIELKYGFDLDSYNTNETFELSEEELMNETLDLMLMTRKFQK